MQNNQQRDISSVLNGIDGADKAQVTKKLMSEISSDDSKQLHEILSDKEKLSAVLNSPAAKAIMSKLNGKPQ